MLQRKIFNVLNRNSSLKPQHQQHKEVSNPKVVQHQLIKKYVTRKTKHINIPIPLCIRAWLLWRHGMDSH